MSHVCWNSRRWSTDCGNLGAEEMYIYKLHVCVTDLVLKRLVSVWQIFFILDD